MKYNICLYWKRKKYAKTYIGVNLKEPPFQIDHFINNLHFSISKQKFALIEARHYLKIVQEKYQHRWFKDLRRITIEKYEI